MGNVQGRKREPQVTKQGGGRATCISAAWRQQDCTREGRGNVKAEGVGSVTVAHRQHMA